MPAERGLVHGRITKDDIRNAQMRRWDGRKRITTDWINLYHEPELCFPNGDCYVYLRESGGSGRGPSFRVHISQLRVKGFGSLVDKCVQQVQFTHEKPECLTNGCKGCGKPSTTRALYLAAPRSTNLENTIDHHLSIRNFFAWLYNVPMAGRTLGKSLVDLKSYLDLHRPDMEEQNQADIMTFADYQRYLDFRECVDHALAAVHFAEKCRIEGLWIDAFAHCVGMANRGLQGSLEYPLLSRKSKDLISKAHLEVDLRLDRVGRSVANFFENDLSSAFLGLHQAAREHLDRFRSFLQSFYIEQHGFWPPQNFDDDDSKKALYIELYSDFRNLYHHLVDEQSSPSMVDNVSNSGGVCTLQNVQAFDTRHNYEALPHPLPRLPIPPALTSSSSTTKLSSLSIGKKRRAQREARDEQSMQSLIDSSNRDWNIMSCLLVRRYSEFERLSVLDDFEKVSLVDGRKVRWILIYAVLQTLITVMQAPKQVRNTEGLSYPLCVHVPKQMPWVNGVKNSFDTHSLSSSSDATISAGARSLNREPQVELTPDVNYSHTNSSSASLSQNPSRSRADRRNSLPPTSAFQTSSTRTTTTISRGGGSSAKRSSSVRRLLSKRTPSSTDENPMPIIPITVALPSLSRKTTTQNKAPAFCEIFVQGYGNGLNDAIVTHSNPNQTTTPSPDTITPKAASPLASPIFPTAEDAPDNVLVSRESSSASASSAYTNRSSASTNPRSGSGTDDGLPEMDHLSVSGGDELRRPFTAIDKGKKRAGVAGSVRRARISVSGANELLDGKRGVPGLSERALTEVHFDTRTWDAFLDID